MVVVADSSPLRYLIVLGEQDLLPELLGEIWIPSAVLDELSASALDRGERAALALARELAANSSASAAFI